MYTAFQSFEPYSSDRKYISSKPNILTITFLSSYYDEVEIAKVSTYDVLSAANCLSKSSSVILDAVAPNFPPCADGASAS